MASGKTKCILPEQPGPSTQKVAEKALTNIFFVEFKEADSGFKNAPY